MGSLRPFQGLHEANYREVMDAIRTLAPELQREGVVDKEIMSALWIICFQAWAEGLNSEGSLRRNGIITQEEIAKLEDWLWRIFYAVSILLESGDVDEAFAGYSPDN